MNMTEEELSERITKAIESVVEESLERLDECLEGSARCLTAAPAQVDVGYLVQVAKHLANTGNVPSSVTKQDLEEGFHALVEEAMDANPRLTYVAATEHVLATERGALLYEASTSPMTKSRRRHAFKEPLVRGDAEATIEKRVRALREAQPKLSESQAFLTVVENDPALYDALDAESR